MFLTKLRLQNKFQQLKRVILKPHLIQEAFIAYCHRLPQVIEVDWNREDGYIIGRVRAGGKEFITQGKDGADFIQMVNESLFTVYKIPDEYFSLMKKARLYSPPEEQRKDLDNSAILQASFGSTKNDHKLQVA